MVEPVVRAPQPRGGTFVMHAACDIPSHRDDVVVLPCCLDVDAGASANAFGCPDERVVPSNNELNSQATRVRTASS